ncbi:MAG: DedA family protein [Sedimentisphaerales bacterium]|nr:DedA family protein [Sedimentisphaerales bacterium]
MKEQSHTLPGWHWHRRLYDWVIHFADTRHGPTALFCLSLAESSFFPVPPDVLLAPLTLGAPKKWFRFALTCSVASVLGGILGYGIGMFLWAIVGPFFHAYVPGFALDQVQQSDGTVVKGMIDVQNLQATGIQVNPTYPLTLRISDGQTRIFSQDQVHSVTIEPFSHVGALYAEHDWKVVATAGFTPLPYKVITITAGVFQINFLIFMIASALSRSARFFLVAGLFGWKGERIRPFIEKYFNWFSLAFVFALIGGFAALKFLH